MAEYIAHFSTLAFALALIGAAGQDVASFRISNTFSLAILAAFALLALALGLDWQQAALHFGFGLVVLAIGAAMFFVNVWGGGDAKLLAAVAVWFGPSAAFLDVLLLVAVSGGLLALALLAARKLIADAPLWTGRLLEQGQGVPYGLAIATGGLAVTIFDFLGRA